MEKCKICDKEFTTVSGLGRHTKLTHKNTPKEYYDRFLKKENEGICTICKQPTNFRNWSVGYLTYCSSRCANSDEKIKEKSRQTYFNKTGYIHNTYNPINKEKIKKTCIEKYGVDHYTKSDEYIEKSKQTCLEKYGVEYSFQSDNNKEKSRQTCIERYGVENPSQNKDIRKKISDSNNLYKKNEFLKMLPDGYTLIKYDIGDIVTIKCPKGHIFTCTKQLIVKRRKANHNFCTICTPLNSFLNSTSKQEKEVIDFIRDNITNDINTNVRNIISPLELDIYIPDLKLAFEFNGLYWHSELYKDKHYHLNKTKQCIEKGIHLIHIYQDDWDYKQEIIKSRILNLLGKSERIYARKCTIQMVDNDVSNKFLDDNHIQGYVHGKYRLGLFYNDILVSLMVFGESRFEKDKTELLRFCNKIGYSVIGGASRLFKRFIGSNDVHDEIISYADRSWSTGGLYEILGFKLINETKPNYSYVIDGMRENRFKYRKSELIRDGYNKNKTEHEIMLKRDIYRIYDSGSLKYVYNI